MGLKEVPSDLRNLNVNIITGKFGHQFALEHGILTEGLPAWYNEEKVRKFLLAKKYPQLTYASDRIIPVTYQEAVRLTSDIASTKYLAIAKERIVQSRWAPKMDQFSLLEWLKNLQFDVCKDMAVFVTDAHCLDGHLGQLFFKPDSLSTRQRMLDAMMQSKIVIPIWAVTAGQLGINGLPRYATQPFSTVLGEHLFISDAQRQLSPEQSVLRIHADFPKEVCGGVPLSDEKISTLLLRQALSAELRFVLKGMPWPNEIEQTKVSTLNAFAIYQGLGSKADYRQMETICILFGQKIPANPHLDTVNRGNSGRLNYDTI